MKLPPLEPGRSYSLNQLDYPAQYYTSTELERLLGVNQPEFFPPPIPGLILPLHEISYTAPGDDYAHFLPQVMQALHTIEWKEQVGRAAQATTGRPFSFLLRLLGKGR